MTEVDAHYLGNVLRVSAGQEIETFDGAGGTDVWEVGEVSGRKVVLRHKKHKDVAHRRPVALRFGLNPLKGGNEETAIRMASAMEVAKIVPVFFFRSDIPLDDERVTSRLNRWERMAKSEVAVSGGAWLPEFGSPVTFEQFLNESCEGVLFYEKAGPGAEDMRYDYGSEVTAAVGPEGGLEESEVEFAREKGLKIASLGPWVLRAELAGVFVPHWFYSRVGDGGKVKLSM